MPAYEFIAFVVIALGALMGAAAGLSITRQPFPVRLVVLGIVARIVGSVARYEVLFRFYGGVGDANRYYTVGLGIADRLWQGDFAVLLSESSQLRWWGTPVVEKASGIVLFFIGPTLRGEFLVFSLLAFAGLYCMAVAIRRTHGPLESNRYAMFIWLWPSLWFWPSSVGKEALLTFALGIAVLGYSQRGMSRWPLLLSGVGLTFAVRPHLAAVVMLAIAIAYWLRSWDRLRLRRVVEGLAICIVVYMTLVGMQSAFGLSSADLEGVQEYLEFRSSRTFTGGGEIENLPSGPGVLLMAFVNIWTRPFIWEAHNATAMLAALEILILWAFAWRNRKTLLKAVKHWRKDSMLAFGAAFVAGYTMMIGITFGNLGIIARQRTLAIPFVFMLLALRPGGATRRVLVRAQRAVRSKGLRALALDPEYARGGRFRQTGEAAP